MEDEKELIEEKLAFVRDNIFDESDFVSDEGYDLTPNYVAYPYEVILGMEQKILRQQKEIKDLKFVLSKYELNSR